MRYQVTQEDINYFRRLIALSNPGNTATTAALLLAAETTADLLFISETMIKKDMPELAKRLHDAACAANMAINSDKRANEITKALCLSQRTDQGQPPPCRDELENAGLTLELADFLAPRLEGAYRTARESHLTTNHRARGIVLAMGLARPQGNPPKQPSPPNTLWRYAELQAKREIKSSDTPKDHLELINEIFLKIDAELNKLNSGKFEKAPARRNNAESGELNKLDSEVFGKEWKKRWDEIRIYVNQQDGINPSPALIMAEIEMFRSATTEHAEAVAFHKANNENIPFKPCCIPQMNNPQIFRAVAEHLMLMGYYFKPGIEKMPGGQRRDAINQIADKIADVFKNNKDLRAQEITPQFRRKVGREKR